MGILSGIIGIHSGGISGCCLVTHRIPVFFTLKHYAFNNLGFEYPKTFPHMATEIGWFLLPFSTPVDPQEAGHLLGGSELQPAAPCWGSVGSPRSLSLWH